MVSGVVFSLLAAVSLNVGNIVEKHAVSGLADLSVRRGAHLFRTLFTSPLWIFGLALSLLGFAFQILAFALAPIAVVQAIFNAGLILLLVLSRLRIGERFQPGEWLGLGVVAVSLIAIGASLTAETSPVGLAQPTWRLFAAAIPTLLVGFLVLLSGRTHLGRSGFLAGIAAGLFYGAATLGTKGASTLVVANGVVASIPKILASPYPYLFVVFCLLGTVVYQTGIQRHRIAIVGSMNDVVSSTYVVVVGTIVFGESLPTDHVILALRATGFAGVLIGSILVVLGGRNTAAMPIADADLGLGSALAAVAPSLTGGDAAPDSTDLPGSDHSATGRAPSEPATPVTFIRAIEPDHPLEVVAELTTRRRRLALQHGHGAVPAEVDHDLSGVALDAEAPVSIRPIEVGPEQGSNALPGGGTVPSPRAGDRTCSSRSNPQMLPRVLTPTDGGSLDGVNASVGRFSTMHEVVGTRIADALLRLVDHDVRFGESPDCPPVHSVQQTRAAARRLRSELLVVGSVLDPVWVDRTRRDLQWLGRALSAVRDVDVLEEDLARMASKVSELPVDSAGIDSLNSILAAQRLDRSRALTATLSEPRYHDLLHRLDQGVGTLPAGELVDDELALERAAAQMLPEMVSFRWRALHRAVRRGGDHPSTAELYRIGIRTERLRYAAEMAAPVLGHDAQLVATAAAQAQVLLGDLHATVVAEEWLGAVAREAPGPLAYSAGVVAGDQAWRRADLQRRWSVCWRRLDGGRARAWLDRL